jgi:hypothetical protein
MLTAGTRAWAVPHSSARFVAFPYHEHFLHDLGAFQLGIGATLLALAWAVRRAPPAPIGNGDHSTSRDGVTAWRCTIRSNHWARDPPVM